MGGQQPTTQWADNLFHEDAIIQPCKTQDEKLIELQNEVKDFCRRVENNIKSLQSEIATIKSSIHGATKEIKYDTMTNVVKHINGLRETGKIKCKPFDANNSLTKLLYRLNIVDRYPSGTLNKTTPFGKGIKFTTFSESSNGSLMYNIEMCVDVWVKFSENPLGLFEEYEKMREDYFKGSIKQ